MTHANQKAELNLKFIHPKVVIPCKLWKKICKGSPESFVSEVYREPMFEPPSASRFLGDAFWIPPPKINIEPENAGLEDDFPFPGGPYSQVPC